MTSETHLPIPKAGTTGRYAVLHHTGIEVPHYDLFIEIADAVRLLTWRTQAAPAQWPLGVFERSADHRLLYMSYEGEVSAGRGNVKRISTGTVVFAEQDARICRVHLHGEVHAELTLPAHPGEAQPSAPL